MSALTVSQVLDRAADLIEPEGAWTQHAFSRTKTGSCNADLRAPRAPACWCALGAIAQVVEFNPARPFEGIAREAMLELDGAICDNTPDWNDHLKRTQPEVVAALRKAAALARGQGK